MMRLFLLWHYSRRCSRGRERSSLLGQRLSSSGIAKAFSYCGVGHRDHAVDPVLQWSCENSSPKWPVAITLGERNVLPPNSFRKSAFACHPERSSVTYWMTWDPGIAFLSDVRSTTAARVGRT